MIQIKNSEQLKLMAQAGRITGEAIVLASEKVKEGITTKELDTVIHDYIVKCGATPSFLGYGDFPASACISINNEVIHGIPSRRRYLKEGDIVKIDVGACYHGFHGDSANTFPVGKISNEAKALIETTKQSFYSALEFAKKDYRIGDIGSAVEQYTAQRGYSVVRTFTGHGIGKNLHESPDVPNFGQAGRGVRLCAGITIAIEPMVNIGRGDVVILEDGWTTITADGSLSAHYEHTVAITEGEARILTKVN